MAGARHVRVEELLEWGLAGEEFVEDQPELRPRDQTKMTG